LKKLAEARRKQIETVTVNWENTIDQKRYEVLRLFYPKRSRNVEIIDGSVEEIVSKLVMKLSEEGVL
jgi:electron transfer flavoprotein alpha/beta subunit